MAKIKKYEMLPMNYECCRKQQAKAFQQLLAYAPTFRSISDRAKAVRVVFFQVAE